MVKFGKTEIAKEKFYVVRKPIKIWDLNVHNIVIPKLVKKSNFKYLVGYLDEDIRPLVLIIPKMGGYVKTFKAEDKINEIMSFCVDDKKLLERYKTICKETGYLKNIGFNCFTDLRRQINKNQNKNVWQ